MAVDPKAFNSISYGLYALTSRDDSEKLDGQIVNTMFEFASPPRLIAFALKKSNLTHDYISKSGVFGLSVLDETTPVEFINLFGHKSGRDIDKLAQVHYETGSSGSPLLTDHTVAIMEGKVTGQLDAGARTIFLGEVERAEVIGQRKPLTYAFYRKNIKG